MNRTEAKTKDRGASRSDCLRVIKDNAPFSSEQVSQHLSREGKKITPNAANCRLLELCRMGELFRRDPDNVWIYHVTPPGKKEACVAYYEKEKQRAELGSWQRSTEKILPLLPDRLKNHLKALKNEINKEV